MSVIRQRTKHLLYAGLTGALAAGLIAAGVLIYGGLQNRKELEQVQERYEAELAEAKGVSKDIGSRKVLVLSRDVEAGDKLTEADVIEKDIPESEAPAYAEEDILKVVGKSFKVAAGKNTPVLASLLHEEGVIPKDLRHEEFKIIGLPSKLKKDDVVDVRIRFPTGQDYIVMAKKHVDDVQEGTLWMKMDEKEILDMSSAIVDAYLQEAKLYALTYVEPMMQEEAVPTYPVNLKVLDLLRTDPNVLEKAKFELAKSMRQLLDKDLRGMDETQKEKISSSQSSLPTESDANRSGSVQAPSVRSPGGAGKDSASPSWSSSTGVSGKSAGSARSTDNPPAGSGEPPETPALETVPSEVRQQQEDVLREAVSGRSEP
ncbi:SAF domain-containing protein [Paenibacillus sp. FJAT-26967]|uniref:SAF domain-containing protein n=1 Tax=Paenibacillus sp. FJAT-26967 TaxID=1729690 RepID=UPI0008388530|nr:SAF domain-containing protein [Paenibacillus sp. FJAT-26967]